MLRMIMEQLLRWRNSPDRKPLLLTGVRQCGKTFVMREFGDRYFEDVAYFNFEGNEELASVFDYNLNPDRIVDELSSFVRQREIVPGKTLVIFDEIQACPRAITSLKYFCENKRELHVMCAGSLLGVAVKRQNISFPVGKVDRLQMYPMSFVEFLCADGGEAMYRSLRGMYRDRPLGAIHTEPLRKALKLYYIVGGMPEAVQKWVETHDFEAVEQIQNAILQDYAHDFSKHAPIEEVPKLGWIWESIPKQLARENNKFMFSHVKEGKRAKDLEDALQWLVDAGLIYQLERVEKPELPLSFCADASYFKVYMSDVGLLRTKAGLSYKTILNPTGDYDRFKGALTENFVMTELLVAGKHPYFWRSSNTAELDFLMEHDGRLIPIEAKSEENTRAKSYRQFCSLYHPQLGFKFSMNNIGENYVEGTQTFSLPLYMIWKLDGYLNEDNEKVPAVMEETVYTAAPKGRCVTSAEKKADTTVETFMKELEPYLMQGQELGEAERERLRTEYIRVRGILHDK